jgi:hypothetical protein
VRKRNLGRSSVAAVGMVWVVGCLFAPVFAAAEDAKPAKKAMAVPVNFDDARLRGDLPAEEAFLDPASILKGKSSPRGEVLFRGKELIVEIYADDEVKIRVSEPFPHDEFIYVLSGELLLTGTDGVERYYSAGDSLMVPRGFTGIWHQSENFRELVVIERKAYDKTYPPE